MNLHCLCRCERGAWPIVSNVTRIFYKCLSDSRARAYIYCIPYTHIHTYDDDDDCSIQLHIHQCQEED